ncbi:ComEA family DNA-binding protein, partial [Nocardioides ginsengisoli]
RPSATRPDLDRRAAAASRLALIGAHLGAPADTPAHAPDPPPAPAAETAVEPRSAEPWWADHTRIVALPMPSPTVPPPPRPPQPRPAPPLPQPGRHAATRRIGPRRVATWRAELLARVPVLGAAHLTVVALAVALGLAVTTWWVVRDRTTQLAPVSADPTGPLVLATDAASASATPTAGASAGTVDSAATPPAAPAAAGPAAPSAAASVTVDVTGKVRHPGIVVLAAGARVTDALAAAGGARRGVSLRSLNLARVLVDGEQIVVGGPPGPVSAAAPPAASGAPAALVNLNTADQAQLETLPQVGPVTAQAILAWRTEHGGFSSVDELLEVDGIGPKTLDRLLAYVTV